MVAILHVFKLFTDKKQAIRMHLLSNITTCRQGRGVPSNGGKSAKIPGTQKRGTDELHLQGRFAPPGGAASRSRPRRCSTPIQRLLCARGHPRKQADRSCVRTTKDNNILRKTNCQVSIYERRARSSAAEHAPIHLHVNVALAEAQTRRTGTNNEMLGKIGIREEAERGGKRGKAYNQARTRWISRDKIERIAMIMIGRS